MNKHIRLIPALALGIAVLSIPTLATAATTVTVGPQSLLVAKGAGAVVSVEVTCAFGDNISARDANIKQLVKKDFVFGSGGGAGVIFCTGDIQLFEILVPAQSTAFSKGSAIATVSVFVCNSDSSVCVNTRVDPEIQLVNK